MFFDPQCKPEVKPSLAGFVAWLEAQDPAARYAYFPCESCAIGEYMKSIGTTYDAECSGGMFDALCEWNRNITGPTPYTFGAALKRARALL